MAARLQRFWGPLSALAIPDPTMFLAHLPKHSVGHMAYMLVVLVNLGAAIRHANRLAPSSLLHQNLSPNLTGSDRSDRGQTVGASGGRPASRSTSGRVLIFS